MIDERFLMHRLKSTSLAAVIVAVAMGGYSLYELYGNGVFRKDLFVFLGIMAVTKISAMIWFRIKN